MFPYISVEKLSIKSSLFLENRVTSCYKDTISELNTLSNLMGKQERSKKVSTAGESSYIARGNE